MISLLPTMTFNNSCRSPSFEAIKTESSAHLKLFMIWPPKLTPGNPLMCLIIYSLHKENKSGENMHPCWRSFLTHGVYGMVANDVRCECHGSKGHFGNNRTINRVNIQTDDI